MHALHPEVPWAVCPNAVQGEPCVLTEAPKMSPTIDGDVSDWNANTNKLRMAFTHGERDGAAVGSPLTVDIRYAWDDQKFYVLVEEVGVDDDPTAGYADDEWCGECNTPPGPEATPAPWNTDSVGFYDGEAARGIKWTKSANGDISGQELNIMETGPYSQFWVGLTTQSDLNKGLRHIVRTLTEAKGESGDILIGPNSGAPRGGTYYPDTAGPLTEVQSAFSAQGDNQRAAEFFMRWDQIRYDYNSTDEKVQERIAELEQNGWEGHWLQDVKQGYEFRLDPLLVDGRDAATFGGQTHPSGILAPSQATGYEDIAVVRLAGPAFLPCDLNADGAVDAADAGVMFGAWGGPGSTSPADKNQDGFVDAADAAVMFADWTGDPNTPGDKQATAEYNAETGELRISSAGAVNVFVQSASNSITPLSPAPTVPVGLLTNNTGRVGITNLGPIEVTNFLFGNIGKGLAMSDLKLVYTTALGTKGIEVPASGNPDSAFRYIPEPASMALLGSGLALLLTARRQRA